MQKYRFNFTLPLTIAFLIVFSILIKLGLWQLERADHKKNLNESYKLRQAEKVIDLNDHKSINSKESILWNLAKEAFIISILLPPKLIPGTGILTA